MDGPCEAGHHRRYLPVSDSIAVFADFSLFQFLSKAGFNFLMKRY